MPLSTAVPKQSDIRLAHTSALDALLSGLRRAFRPKLGVFATCLAELGVFTEGRRELGVFTEGWRELGVFGVRLAEEFCVF